MTTELLSEQGFRADGRRVHELRKLNCRVGVFEQADGSAYLEIGNTRVLAAVYGPHEIRGRAGKGAGQERAVINCQYSMATFSTSERKHRPRGDYRAIEITSNLRQVFDTAILCELYPHSQIDIYLEVLQSDGSNYSACVNAATLALVHAGIAVKDMVCACSAGFISNQPVTDVNYAEESISAGPVLTIALLPKSQEILSMESTGRIGLDEVDKVMDAAIAGCLDLVPTLKATVLNYVTDLNK